jgi:hypothetical protein
VGRWLLLIGVVGVIVAAAAWPLLAAGQPLGAVAIGVTGAVVVAFGPWLLDWARTVLAAAGRARRRMAGLVAGDPHGSAAWLLHPASEVIDFFGRTQELEELTAWCRDDRAFPVRLVTAPAGYGKTRLARRLAGVVQRWRGWRSWPVRVGREQEAAAVVREGKRLLLVVDYAESRPAAGLAELVVAAGARRRVRLLLLARTVGPWWRQLAAYAGQPHAELDSLTSATPVMQLPVRVDQRSPEQIAADAAGQFAGWLGRCPTRRWSSTGSR